MRGVVGRVAGSRRHDVPAVLLALSLLASCSRWSARGDQPEAPAPEPTLSALQRLAPAEVSPAAGATRAATRVDRVTVETEPGGTRVVLDLDGFAKPEVSLLGDQRLVVDVPGTTCQALPREIEVPGDPLVERVRTGQHAAPALKSRVVIDLRSRADFAVRAQNGRVFVLLAPAGSDAAAAGEQSAAAHQVLLRAEPPVPAPADAQARATLAPPAPPAAVTPVPEPAAEPAAPALVAASPASEPDDTAPTPSPRGKRISIDFTAADVRTVLELIASAGGYQVMFTPNVAGVITIALVDRPWDDALNTVLRAKRLREVHHEDIMLISAGARDRADTRHSSP